MLYCVGHWVKGVLLLLLLLGCYGCGGGNGDGGGGGLSCCRERKLTINEAKHPV